VSGVRRISTAACGRELLVELTGDVGGVAELLDDAVSRGLGENVLIARVDVSRGHDELGGMRSDDLVLGKGDVERHLAAQIGTLAAKRRLWIAALGGCLAPRLVALARRMLVESKPRRS
jgi:hypothetical protein